jgi:hypothetical protein
MPKVHQRPRSGEIKVDELVQRLKERERVTKRKNTTFRLPEQLVFRFRQACHAKGIQPTDVLAELMAGFLGEEDA